MTTPVSKAPPTTVQTPEEFAATLSCSADPRMFVEAVAALIRQRDAAVRAEVYRELAEECDAMAEAEHESVDPSADTHARNIHFVRIRAFREVAERLRRRATQVEGGTDG